MSGFDTAILLTKEVAVREAVNMSNKDLDRLHILKKVQARELTQVDAGQLLKIGERQIRRLLVRLEEQGPKGIVSKLVGRQGNRSKPKHFKQGILALLKEKYEGFGPTLAAEKLLAIEGLKISAETIRKWMIESHLWISRKKRPKQHLLRLRRACFGELLQGDGSPHRWFGEDEPEANATVLIDDATGIITGLFFSETETLEGYFKALEQHLNRYGRPRALYTDRYSVFCSHKGTGKTQMQMALGELDIQLILARSAQAKGRVERVNRTLQDRLTKEFRLRGIKTIEQANKYAAEYVEEHNKKFSKKPMSAFDAHRSLEGYDLERILCRKEERSLNSSGIFQFNKVFYQIQGVSEYRRLNKRKVEIRVTRAGMRVFLAGRQLEVLRLDEIIGQPLELNRKEVMNWHPKEYKVKASHPWKTGQTGVIKSCTEIKAN
jgi:transposase InsO family protein